MRLGLIINPSSGRGKGAARGQLVLATLKAQGQEFINLSGASMDEANASVSIDLSGRPFPVFEGTFATPFIGDYRTDLTAHVFRSLAEAMGAAVHVSVTGDDDHHKTEAVYKAFGRALRQAIRIESDVVPSSKGVL